MNVHFIERFRRGASGYAGGVVMRASIVVFMAALAGAWWPAIVQAVEANALPGAPGKRYLYKHSGGKPLAVEVFSPEGHDPAASKVPGIILFHGGNWTDGSAAELRYECRYFAARGLVAATADYRMLSAHGPDKDRDAATGMTRKQVCVQDAKSAIRWFKEYADALGVDPGRIIAGGTSAGGHLAVLATTTPELDDPADPEGIDTKVAAYVLWCPACTEADAADPPVDARRHVGAGFAPAVVFFGTDDPWLRHWKNLTQYSIRPRGGAEPTVWFAPGGDHTSVGRAYRLASLAEADRFLVERGLLEPAAAPPLPVGGPRLVSQKSLESGEDGPRQ